MKSAVPREPRKVTIIPATPKRMESGNASRQKLRVAAYCRVSTDSEEQINSYKNQLAYYTEKSTANRVEIRRRLRRRGHHRHQYEASGGF